MELEKRTVDRVLEALTPALQAELDRVIQEVRSQLTEEMQAEFNRTLQETGDRLQAKFEEELHHAAAEWEAERARLQHEIRRWRVFTDAQRELAECTSQAEILVRFLNLAGPFAASIAVYVSKGDRLALWKTRGPAAFSEAPSDSQDPEIYFKPVVVRRKTVAGVSAAESYNRETLDLLVDCLERSIEMFGLKLHTQPRPVSA
jgi:hypothetical protein